MTFTPTNEYGNNRPRPSIQPVYVFVQIRQRFKLEDDKPVRTTIPFQVYVEEQGKRGFGWAVNMWRCLRPQTHLLRFISARITEELRPDVVALARQGVKL